jgi:elongation factor P hydroxylase
LSQTQPPVTADVVVATFNRLFKQSEDTVLVAGASEPFYLPGQPNQVFFRADYVRSALHEAAHWCVAGPRRRGLPDYGYWYTPDGRSAERQTAFFSVEAKPQAIESLFCESLNVAFAPSVDNLLHASSDSALRAFEDRIGIWRARLLGSGLPRRASRFMAALECCDGRGISG